MKRNFYREKCEDTFRNVVLAGAALVLLPLCLLFLRGDYYVTSITNSQIILHLCHFVETVLPSLFNIILMIAAIICIISIPAGLLKSLYLFGRGLTFPSFIKPYISEISSKERAHRERAESFPVIDVESPVPFALAGGILRKKIFISSSLRDLLTPHEFNSVIFHEVGHLKMGHPLKRILVRAILGIIVLIPFRKELFRKFCVLSELAADEYSVRAGADPAVLAGAIIKMAKGQRLAETHGLVGFTDSHIKDRIHALLGLTPERSRPGEKKHHAHSKVLRSVPALIFCLFLLQPFIQRPDGSFCITGNGEAVNTEQRSNLISVCTEMECGKCSMCDPIHKTHL